MVSLKKLIPLAFAGLAMGAIILSPAASNFALADVSGNNIEEERAAAQAAIDNAYLEAVEESNAVTNQQVTVGGSVVSVCSATG